MDLRLQQHDSQPRLASRALPSALLLLLAISSCELSARAFVLRDVAAKSGVVHENLCGSHTSKRFIIEQNGAGTAVFDYDGDGDLDLFLVNGADMEILEGHRPAVRNALFRNEGNWQFRDVTETTGLGDTGWGVGVAAGDLDNDGDTDLYVTNFGANVLYENLGDGRFRDVTETAGVGDEGWSHSAAFGDMDHDGDLDLYVTNNLFFDLENLPQGDKPCVYREMSVSCGPLGFPKQPDRLYRNDGDLRFSDISEPSGVHSPDPEHGLGVAVGDLDDDGLLDIYVANDSGPNYFFHNLGGARFEEIAWMAGIATQNEGRFQAGMGVALGDVDGNGKTDIFLTNFSQDHNTLYLNQGDAFFSDDSYGRGVGAASWPWMGWGTSFVDLDQDGDQDLYVANGHVYPEADAGLQDETYAQPDTLLLNDGRGHFSAASESIEKVAGPGVSRGIAFGDIDEDGDIDLLISEMGASPSLLRNEGDHGRSIQIRLRGRESNREGAGARARLRTGDRVQTREATRSGSYCSSSDPRLHFGVGETDIIEELEIRWPSGKKQRFQRLSPDLQVVVFE